MVESLLADSPIESYISTINHLYNGETLIDTHVTYDILKYMKSPYDLYTVTHITVAQF